MKEKDVLLGMDVALASKPKTKLGTVTGMKGHGMVEVTLAGTDYTTTYGVKVLMKYEDSV